MYFFRDTNRTILIKKALEAKIIQIHLELEMNFDSKTDTFHMHVLSLFMKTYVPLNKLQNDDLQVFYINLHLENS